MVSGVVFAAGAGIGFGLFQAVNRRANQAMDAYRATFLLLLVGSASMALFSLFTRDLSSLQVGSPRAFLFFAGAGIVHFFLGWTFLSLSQQQVGAATTGAVLGSTPLIGSILAAVVLGESLRPLTAVGILLAATGVTLLSLRRSSTLERRVPWFALGAAASWGSSPLFIRWGLRDLDDPIIGVTFGLLAATFAYAIALFMARRARSADPVSREGLAWVTLAGVMVAACIALQWIAFDRIAIAIAITVMQLSAPTVVTVAPLLVKSDAEKPTLPMLLGMAAVLAGSVVVVLSGTG